MAQIAKVAALTGKAYVVGVDGLLRALKVGDVIEKGEIIRTDVGAQVELAMIDGKTVAVAPEANVRVDESMVQVDSRPAAQDSAVQNDSVQAVIQALDRGGDLNQELEAAAAGTGGTGGESGGDATFVRLLRIVEPTDPLAYNYTLSPLTTTQVIDPGALVQTTTDLPVINATVTTASLPVGTDGATTVTADVIQASVTGMQVLEGTDKDTNKVVNFLFTLDKVPTADVIITFVIRPGSTSAGTDITDGPTTIGTPVTITIPAGVNGFVVPVSIVQDGSIEGNETFSIELLDAKGATLGNRVAEVTIVDDDIAIKSSTHTVDESNGIGPEYSVTDSLGVEYKGSGTTPLVSLKADGATWDAESHTLTANDNSWKVVVDPTTGKYTFTQLEAMHHTDSTNPNDGIEINITAKVETSVVVNGETVISSATAPIVITVLDDGPSVTDMTVNANGAVVTDETNQLNTAVTGTASVFTGGTVTLGSDSGTTDVSLRIDTANTGLYTTAGNHLITLVADGSNNNIVYGKYDTNNDGTPDTTAFTVSMTDAGVLTVTQAVALKHGDPTLSDEAVNLSGKLSAVVTATDGDLDVASKSVSIGASISFKDDGPRVMNSANLIASTGSGNDVGGEFSYSIGADANSYPNQHDFSSVRLTNGTVAGLPITIASSSMSLVGTESADSVTYSFNFDYNGGPAGSTQQASGTLTFDKLAHTYTVNLSTPLTYSQILTTSGTISKVSYDHIGDLTAGTSSNPDVVVSKLSDNFYVQFSAFQKTTGQNAQDLSAGGDTTLSAGETISGGTGWVSISNSANGVSGDTLGKGEVLDMDFFNTSPGSTTNTPGNALLNGMFLKFDGISATEDLVIVLKLAHADGTSAGTKTLIVSADDIIKTQAGVPSGYNIQLDNNDGVVFIESNDFKTAGQDLYISGAQVITSTENLSGTAFALNGAVGTNGNTDLNTTVPFGGANDPTDDSDVVKITDIGFISTATTTPLADLNFEVQLQDADGDKTAAQNLNVLIINGQTYTGTSSDETLTGTGTNDALIGGAGNDVLNGLGGSDVFQWHLGDQSTTGTAARDVVDFNVKQGDVLDLRDLLMGEHSGSNLGEFIHFGTDSATGKLMLSVDHDGTAGSTATFTPDQNIVLKNYADKAALVADLGLNSPTDADILNKLVQTGQLKTDA